MQKIQEPATVEKFTRGPVGFLTVMPNGPPGIGKNLVIWFAYSIWKAQPWTTTLKNVLDGILYGLVTAAIFASLGNWGV